MCFICNGNHHPSVCDFPNLIKRCTTCFKPIINDEDEEHECRLATVNSIRENGYVLPIKEFFHLKFQRDEAALYCLDPFEGKFGKLLPRIQLSSASTNGLFKVEHDGNSEFLSYASTKFFMFSIFICVKKEEDNQPILSLRAITSRKHGVMLFKADKTMRLENDRLDFPRELNKNTILILGIKTTNNKFTMDVGQMETPPNSSVKWSEENGWEIPAELDGKKLAMTDWLESLPILPHGDDSPNAPSEIQPAEVEFNQPSNDVCYNCGQKHSFLACDYPKFFYPCYRCLVISFDGHSHCSPCMPMNTISPVRFKIISRKTAPLFGLRFVGVECDVSYLTTDGTFEELPQTLISPTANCIISTHGRKYKFIDFSSAYFTRFSFAISVFQEGLWRKRFSVVISNKHGVLVFKAHSTLVLENGRFTVPGENVIVIGLKPKRSAFDVAISVYANKSGTPNDDKLHFNGYSGELSWSMLPNDEGEVQEKTKISESLDGYSKKNEVKFNSRIFYLMGNPISTFSTQR